MATKTVNVMIRLTPRDRARLQRVAAADYLEAATWARQALLRALDAAERPSPASAQAPTSKPSGRPARGRTS
jgi:hypothetical protein